MPFAPSEKFKKLQKIYIKKIVMNIEECLREIVFSNKFLNLISCKIKLLSKGTNSIKIKNIVTVFVNGFKFFKSSK